jgi:pyruvate dehydrogenase E2 component (dihydrolipoamide acetyltransferase)
MSDVLMPQMGESVTEGTIVRWMKRVGESVDRDEPLFEISTDKVDAEIPSPQAGVLREIRVPEGETVAVHTVVAVIESAGDAAAAPGVNLGGEAATPERDVRPMSAGSRPTRVASGRSESAPRPSRSATANDNGRVFVSPVVRAMARDHGVDVRQVRGSGTSGRVTRHDMEAFLAGDPSARRVLKAPVYQPGDPVRIEKMSVIRRKIAEHMVTSRDTSAHVYSAYEVDFSRVDALRRQHKARYEAEGASLTFTAFIAHAAAATIREHPLVNASVDDDEVVYKADVNLGIAVALEQGLIVPVVRKADTLSLMALSRHIADLATRARSKHLKVEEVEGGTFTITNPGIFGGLWGLPIINQPQVAILAVGSIDKRPVVVDDQVVVRPMCYLTLGYDHRLIDGADGGRFLQALKKRLEDFDESVL